MGKNILEWGLTEKQTKGNTPRGSSPMPDQWRPGTSAGDPDPTGLWRPLLPSLSSFPFCSLPVSYPLPLQGGRCILLFLLCCRISVAFPTDTLTHTLVTMLFTWARGADVNSSIHLYLPPSPPFLTVEPPRECGWLYPCLTVNAVCYASRGLSMCERPFSL